MLGYLFLNAQILVSQCSYRIITVSYSDKSFRLVSSFSLSYLKHFTHLFFLDVLNVLLLITVYSDNLVGAKIKVYVTNSSEYCFEQCSEEI